MRGDNVKFTAAHVIDTEGNVQYHVLPTRWVTFGIIGFCLMLLIAVVLGLLIINNKKDIDNLRQETIEVNEGHDANTSNTNR